MRDLIPPINAGAKPRGGSSLRPGLQRSIAFLLRRYQWDFLGAVVFCESSVACRRDDPTLKGDDDTREESLDASTRLIGRKI